MSPASPSVDTKGCFFHFNQALFRKWCKLGLKTLYNNPTYKNWLKMMMAIPLVPMESIEDAYIFLIDK